MELDPADGKLRSDVARALINAGQMERAQPFLTAESVGEDVDLLLAVERTTCWPDGAPMPTPH